MNMRTRRQAHVRNRQVIVDKNGPTSGLPALENVGKMNTASSDNPNSSRAVTTQQDGNVYLAAYVPQYNNIYALYPQNDVNASKIFHMKYNIYIASVERKQRSLIFAIAPAIEVKDPDGEIDEELQTHITQMMDSIEYLSKIMQAWSDIFFYGMSIFNWVWEKVGNEVVITHLDRLPAYSFDTPKPGVPLAHSPILQGVMLPTDFLGGATAGEELEFYQRTSMINQIPRKLNTENLFWVKDPASGEVAGDPVVLPIIPIVEMLNYTWNASMQYVGRVGAPPLFIKIEAPQGPNQANSYVGDVQYAQVVLANWGKDNQYPLRPNMTPIFMPTSASTENATLAFIDALNWMIVDYMTPTSFISQKSGAVIGGSKSGENDIFNMYVQGVHRWLEEQFNRILTRYLEVNGYKEYTAKIVFPLRGEDESVVMIQQATAGFQSGVLDFNELRERLEAEGVDDQTKQQILEEQKQIRAAITPPGGASATGQPPVAKDSAPTPRTAAPEIHTATPALVAGPNYWHVRGSRKKTKATVGKGKKSKTMKMTNVALFVPMEKKVHRAFNSLQYEDLRRGILAKEVSKFNITKMDLDGQLDKELIAVLPDGTKVFAVNGGYVRNNFDVDFVWGGHYYAYPKFIPKDEIWVERHDDEPEDFWACLLHEVVEYLLMKSQKLSYEAAHQHALKSEAAYRADPTEDNFDRIIGVAIAFNEPQDAGKPMEVMNTMHSTHAHMVDHTEATLKANRQKLSKDVISILNGEHLKAVSR